MSENQAEIVDSLWNSLPDMGYDSYDETREGVWRTYAESDEEDPIAIIWTDNDKGAGIMWTKQTEEVMRIFKLFALMKLKGESAPLAFNIMDRMVEGSYGEHEEGVLSELGKKFWELSENNG